ncbi:hypothetical protein N7522_001461 [Penicillium canescens]|nr:hypothetical protein N7522_001461 [Penicillium canescens]
MPIENDTADGTRGPAPVPGNPGRSLRQTSAREETVKNMRDEMHKKEEKLKKLLNKTDKRPADEKMIDKLRKELNHYTSSDAKQSDHAQAVPVAGGEVPDIERAKRKSPAQPEPGHAESVADVEMPGNVPISPNANVDSTTKTRYPESGAEDNEREPNLAAQTESPTSSSSAKQGTDAGNPQGKTRAAIQSITFQHMKDEGVDIVEEGYLHLGPRIWMVRGYGFPHGAKYEMEVIQCASDWQRLDELPRLSSTEKRLSILKNENGRRQYTIDNIERIDAVTVLPYGRRKGKKRNHDNETKPKNPRFRLTLVQVKWKNILEEHVKKLKEGRTWEPRSELLGMVGRKCQAQLDRDIFEMCRTQDKRNASWLKEKKLSHLERPETPLPGKVEWISGREESRKEAARIRTPDRNLPKQRNQNWIRKERIVNAPHIPPSKRSTGTDNDPNPPEESEVSGESEDSEQSEEEDENVFSYESYLATTMAHEGINDKLLQTDEKEYRRRIRKIRKDYPRFKETMEAQGYRESK